MKEIKAYIKLHKLTEVTMALHRVEGLTGASVSEVRGFGRGQDKSSRHHVGDGLIDYEPHVKIEVVCREELTEAVVSAIQTAAHTGLRGDGKVYVIDVEDVVRIETNERGDTAV